jgi:hypothetical protein
VATSYLSIPVTGVASQALTQVQTRLDGVFGRRRIPLEYVRDGDGDLTEIIVILSDSLPEEDIRAFRRAMLNIDGTLGAAVDVPLGAGGGVAGGKVSDFDAQAPGAPVGFAVLGTLVQICCTPMVVAVLHWICRPRPSQLACRSFLGRCRSPSTSERPRPSLTMALET